MSQQIPEPVANVIRALSRLPSIGPRQATRLAFYLISQGGNTVHALAADLQQLSRMKLCAQCFFIHQNPASLCSICASPARRQDIIMIVEKETDLISLEATGKFPGRYLIVGTIGKTGILEDWQQLRLQSLKDSLTFSPAEEIIIAFNPTSFGDAGASAVLRELDGHAKKFTRLGRGLPTGGEIEFADEDTLGDALQYRK